jgi:nucleoside phosphorylase
MGIAGAYRGTSFNIGDIALIEDDFFVDEAKLSNNTLDSTSLLGFPVIEGNKVSFRTEDFDLPICNANTVSLLGDSTLTELYHKATDAHMESMEGAAFGTVAKAFGREAIHIRAVSNYCGDDDGWDPKKACKALAAFIDGII